MIVIADAGSTKIEWCAVNAQGGVSTFETPGVNALMLCADELRAAFEAALGDLRPDAIYYYGAGCAAESVCCKVSDALPRAPRVEVASDMLGAARGLLGRRPGLAAILGTGSNSAAYDGCRLTANMPPLGFILGDEGSGAAMGRRLLRRVYRTGRLRRELEEYLAMDYAQVLDAVYRRPAANRFLGSLVPFVVCRREELADMIAEEFDAFFGALSAWYAADERRLSLTGGVAAALGPELREAAARARFVIDKIEPRPMKGLIEYHCHE